MRGRWAAESEGNQKESGDDSRSRSPLSSSSALSSPSVCMRATEARRTG